MQKLTIIIAAMNALVDMVFPAKAAVMLETGSICAIAYFEIF